MPCRRNGAIAASDPRTQRKAEGEHMVLVADSLEGKPEVLPVWRINRYMKVPIFQVYRHEQVNSSIGGDATEI